MSRLDSIQRVLIVGSDPIVIGQAAEFDYAGTRVCRALCEEDVGVILVNSDPATVMIDNEIVDEVYIEPLTTDTLKKVVLKERPDSVLPTLDGQNALNLAVKLEESDSLMEHNVRMIGTDADTIHTAKGRELFKEAMACIQQLYMGSEITETVEDDLLIAERIGYPVMVCPAYALGNSGDGVAYTEEQLHAVAFTGLYRSHVNQVSTEYCISGWKEIEHEVIRDGNGNCITVCNTENFDPVGVHTGDSIIIASYQMLADEEVQMLRNASIAIINEPKVEGGCNMQFALNPESFEYCVIEINPHVSRSSALASKATGYPIAEVASKTVLGCTPDEIQNAITKKAYACLEPTLDYCVMKIPKWPFDKFVHARRSLGIQMKTTGGIMGITPAFEAALMKSIRCLERNMYDLADMEFDGLSDLNVFERIHTVDDHRLFAVTETLRRGFAMEKIHSVTEINRWFLQKLQSIIAVGKRLVNEPMSKELLLKAESFGFLDETVAKFSSVSIEEVRGLKEKWAIRPVYKMVDTCTAEFEAETLYCYLSYGDENGSCHESGRRKTIVVGSGPIRIGQSIEFDFCPVHNVRALKKLGFETVIISNNPEAVNTDFNIVDRLYFEPLTPEGVWHIVELERPNGVVVQFDGQTTIKLAGVIEKMDIPPLGISFDGIGETEDCERLDAILAKCGILHATDRMVLTCDETLRAAHKPDYPVLARPSYVLGGQGMDIVYNNNDVRKQIGIINTVAQEYPILVDEYLMGIEIEVDTVCDGVDTLVPGIIQYVGHTGVCSGSSISVYPAQSLLKQVEDMITDYTRKLALALRTKGFLSVQFIVKDKQVYIIEANPCPSRTVLYISRIMDIPIVHLAVHTFFGETSPQMGYQYGLQPNEALIAIEMPVFSFERLYGVDVNLGLGMRSIGEVLGIAKSFKEAMIKAFQGADMHFLTSDNMIITVKDQNKEEVPPIAKGLCDLGRTIYSTEGTPNCLKENGIPNVRLNEMGGGAPDILDAILSGTIDLVINTPFKDTERRRDGSSIRRNMAETDVPYLTLLDTANTFLRCVQYVENTNPSVVDITKVSSSFVSL